VDLPLVSVIEQEYSTTDKMKTVEQLVDNLNEVVLQHTQRLWSSTCDLSMHVKRHLDLNKKYNNPIL